MDAVATKASYARMLDQSVGVRRYSGTGPGRSYVQANARARVVGYLPDEVVGSIQQGDRKAIVYADDLIGSAVSLPVLGSDKLVVRGRELQIVAVDDSTRRVQDVLIAYELVVRG